MFGHVMLNNRKENFFKVLTKIYTAEIILWNICFAQIYYTFHKLLKLTEIMLLTYLSNYIHTYAHPKFMYYLLRIMYSITRTRVSVYKT